MLWSSAVASAEWTGCGLSGDGAGITFLGGLVAGSTDHVADHGRRQSDQHKKEQRFHPLNPALLLAEGYHGASESTDEMKLAPTRVRVVGG